MTNNSEHVARIIIGKQLRKARELLQLAPQEVASELNISAQDILDWENVKSQPNVGLLERLADLYGREIDYFLKETPALPEKIEFRGKPGQSLKELPKAAKIVLSRFDELCRTALEIEKLLGKKREIKLSCFKESESPEAVANSLRKTFNAFDKPIPELRISSEHEGVRIFELPVLEDAFSGFSYWHPDYGPCILLNAAELKGRKNFTLAHEIAHLLYKHGSSLCYIPLEFREPFGGLENKANQVAVALLLPKSGVIEDFRKRNLSIRPSEKDLILMASKWGVSVQALGYRLENLGLIEKGVTDKFVESRPKHLRRPKTPSWERQLGKGFVGTAFEAFQKGLITSGKLADSLGITIREALKEIELRRKKKS
jgi:Zn-dependent peptidase ImmA (M78 family)/DNA-binding XRE family transcriptional regulator